MTETTPFAFRLEPESRGAYYRLLDLEIAPLVREHVSNPATVTTMCRLLAQWGVVRVGQAMALERQDLERQPGVGKKFAPELDKVLAAIGLRLG